MEDYYGKKYGFRKKFYIKGSCDQCTFLQQYYVLSAYISIPLPTGAHITFLNFIVLLIALVFPWQDSLVITLLWLVLGAIGIPVFIEAMPVSVIF